jgi:hypothetical protein
MWWIAIIAEIIIAVGGYAEKAINNIKGKKYYWLSIYLAIMLACLFWFPFRGYSTHKQNLAHKVTSDSLVKMGKTVISKSDSIYEISQKSKVAIDTLISMINWYAPLLKMATTRYSGVGDSIALAKFSEEISTKLSLKIDEIKSHFIIVDSSFETLSNGRLHSELKFQLQPGIAVAIASLIITTDRPFDTAGIIGSCSIYNGAILNTKMKIDHVSNRVFCQIKNLNDPGCWIKIGFLSKGRLRFDVVTKL